MRQFFVFLLVSIAICHGVRKTRLGWWFGNIKGTDTWANEIDGIYNVALRNQRDSSYQLYKKNSEDLLHYITITKWKFYRENFMDSEMFYYDNINLVFEGIDTLSSLQVNNQDLEATDNMFHPHIYHLKDIFRFEYNSIFLTFEAIYSKTTELYSSYNKTTKLYPECPPQSYHGRCYIFMVRKMQSAFGSSIGPAVPSMGIWRPAYFEAYNETVIREVTTNIKEESDHWSLKVDVFFANNTRGIINGAVEINILDLNSKDKVTVEPNEDREFSFTKTLKIPKEKVKLWWPVGYGEQQLYRLDVQFLSNRGEVSSKMLRIGFRKVELIQETIGTGTSFYFKVNDRPIFMKGTVLPPLSLQPELGQDRETINNILNLAVAANMNTIRVWGGGVYQENLFYEKADELGLLIWQDMMFKDLSYPTDKKFLKSVGKEVRYQVRRIKNHPSVIVFCGNDEGELALFENRYQQNRSKTVQEDYIKLFEHTIKSEFANLTDGKGIFLRSTPLNGKTSNNKITEKPNDPLHGDIHFFDSGSNDPFKHNTYPIPRFVSSYGLQSLPKMESFLKDTTDHHDLDLDFDFLRRRQHLTNGFGQLKKTIEHQILYPKVDDTEVVARAVSYYSQIVQAYAMRIQTERYRSYRSITTKDGHGQTMGTLFWHFTDLWTATTWSSIDFFGEWKMLQYYIPDFFSPIIVTGQFGESDTQKTTLDIYVVSDVEKIERAQVRIRLGKWSGLGTISEISFQVAVDAGSSKLVRTIDDVKTFMSQRGCTKEECFIHLSLERDKQPIAPENFLLPNPLKNSKLEKPSLKLRIKKLPYKQIYEITVSTDKNALFVWLDAHEIDGHFSENGFLQITPTKKVFFYSKLVTDVDQLTKILTVIHVNSKFDYD